MTGDLGELAKTLLHIRLYRLFLRIREEYPSQKTDLIVLKGKSVPPCYEVDINNCFTGKMVYVDHVYIDMNEHTYDDVRVR